MAKRKRKTLDIPDKLRFNVSPTLLDEVSDIVTALSECKKRVKASPFAKGLLELLLSTMLDKRPDLKVPREVVQKILLNLPAAECWRIARGLDKRYREWVPSEIDIYMMKISAVDKIRGYEPCGFAKTTSKIYSDRLFHYKGYGGRIVFEKEFWGLTPWKVRYQQTYFSLWKNDELIYFGPVKLGKWDVKFTGRNGTMKSITEAAKRDHLCEVGFTLRE